MLAHMLTEGIGLPAAQPEAAGRYWRLAAEGGSVEAQFRLANYIRETKVPARLQIKGERDQGAQEIVELYLTAFARGRVEAGIKLAKLYRTGFPEERGGSKAIPKDAAKAIDLLGRVRAHVRTAPPDDDAANPLFEALAAFELVDMYDAGEHKVRGPSGAMTEDQTKQIGQLKSEYGSLDEAVYVTLTNYGDTAPAWAPRLRVHCSDPRAPSLKVLLWNSKEAEPPTERMFDWYERRYRCKEVRAAPGNAKDAKSGKDANKVKPEDLGVPKAVRDVFRREFEAAQKGSSNPKAPSSSKTFVERMVEWEAKNNYKR
jgi:TPR repeat protein